ncbi:MAG: sensor histidine kinase [Cyclobacteriaceae bacterium]
MTKKSIKEYSVIVMISSVGSAILTYLSCASCQLELKRFLWVTFFSAILWISLWIGNGKLTHLVSTKISWVEFPLKRFIWGIVSTVIYTVTVVLLISKVWELIFKMNFDSYYEVVIPSLIITFFISLILHSREFLIQWRKSAVDGERLKKESVAAQYESLKSQVNPHFLFNSLNALTNLVYEDQDKAAKFIKQLSEVYRYVLDTREKEVVPLEDELRFLESYFFLQKIRFGENLRIENKLSGVSSMIAPLALQLLMENAIKHNVISTDDPLTIKLYQDQSAIVVENSLRKKISALEESNGMGIDNIKKRYQYLTNREVLVMETTEKFIVKLPIIEIEKA